jgi:hypothetical protein
MNRGEAYRGLVGAGVAAVVAFTAGVEAHDAHVAGPYRLEIGWSDEPALTGSRNAVAVEITEGKSAVLDGSASLSAEVSFGGERLVLPLEPDPERRNVYQAKIVPTRAGTYTFHITGRIKTQPIDITTTCSEKTFDCVIDGSEIQFPVKDPSAGQIAERLNRALPRAEQALESARRAQWTAWWAIGIAAIAAASGGLRLRRGK